MLKHSSKSQASSLLISSLVSTARTSIFLAASLCFAFSGVSAPVLALSGSQKQLFDTGTNYYNEQAANDCGASGGGETTLAGSDNMQKIYNYFTGKGLTGQQAAGILGNMLAEDPSLMPTTVQGGGQSNTPPSHGGYGIVQWTPGTKLVKIITSAHIGGKASDLAAQLDALWAQLYGSSDYSEHAAGDDLKKQTTPKDAAVSFLAKYERATDHSPTGTNAKVRGGKAEEVYQLYGGNSGSSATNGDSATATSSTCGGGDSAVDCQGNSNAALSDTRQKVVCLAESELKNTWTPLPNVPRMQYLKYTDGAQEQWCADFVSWLYKQAGDPFTGGASGGWRIAGVPGIIQLGQNGGGRFHYHTSNYTPKPGDMAIHRGHQHVNLVVSVVGKTVVMIGGDQGSGPYGGPNSASIVSKEQVNGYFGGDITGYVSPD